MKRFVFLSFAFLGWAFYELSGGADFQPRVAATPAPSESGIAAATPATTARPANAATLVASPAIATTIALARTARITPAPTPTPVAAVLNTEPETDPDIKAAAKREQIRTSLGQGLLLFPDADPIALPLMLTSLEQGAAGLSTAPITADTPEPAAWTPPPADIREITGTRVNMRDGPGTIYPVITRLTIGHEVEVLGESGTGWLRLRSLPEQQIGWISASLVSKAPR